MFGDFPIVERCYDWDSRGSGHVPLSTKYCLSLWKNVKLSHVSPAQDHVDS